MGTMATKRLRAEPGESEVRRAVSRTVTRILDETTGQTKVMYEVCHDEKGEGLFNPCGLICSTKTDGLKELKRVRQRYPNAYLARVEFSRCNE